MSLFRPEQAPPQVTTTQMMIPPASPEEMADRQLARQIQLASLQQAGYDVRGGQLVPRAPTAQQRQLRDIESKLSERLLAQLEGRAPEIAPETRELVEREYASAQTMGQKQIQELARAMAASRGLNVTDTPIAAEAMRAGQDLQTRLAGGQASALLNAAQARNIFSENVRQFQEGLKQQSFQNLLAAQQGPMASAAQLGALRGQTQTTRAPGPFMASPFGQVLQPLGSLASGIGAGAFGLGALGWKPFGTSTAPLNVSYDEFGRWLSR